MRPFAAVLFALSALAQDLPEIRGTVTEYSTNIPIAAAEVTFYEFLTIDGVYTRQPVTKVLTDSRGTFILKPDHPGKYFAEARKATYLTAQELDAMGPVLGYHRSEAPLDVTRERLPDPRFTLIRTGGLTGRVVDEKDKPVADFTVTAPVPGIPIGLGTRAVTNKDGIFTFEALVPSPRMIRVSSSEKSMALDYAPEEDIETAYWPGGFTDPSLALPVNMIPGAVVNVGTIRLRKIPYYRAHITYKGACVPGERWTVSFVGGSFFYTRDCASEFIVGSLLPGPQNLIVWNSEAQLGGTVTKWAVLPITIDRENVDLSLAFTPSIDVPVRIINADGGKLPPLADLRVRLLATGAGFGARSFDGPIDPQGRFTIPTVPWPRHQVEVSVGRSLAVKDIRYNGQSVTDASITLAPGSPLEIVVDDKPGAVSGTTEPLARIYLAKWPYAPVAFTPYRTFAQADAAGQFQIGSLAAGEYRAVALRGGLPDVQAMGQLFAAAPKITLERGAQQTIELKPVDPSR